jgi:deazaflavin-dependent oxidoreductase (nitroreductase family)
MVKTGERVPAPPRPTFVMKMTNTALSLLLRSPFHKRMSNTLLLLTFQGRKSGKRYSFPVGYILEGKADLIILTPKMRSWWKNFRSGAPVIVYMQGQKRQGTARVFDDNSEAIAQGITKFLRHNPKAAPMYRVELGPSGEPTPETLQQIIPYWTVVRIHLAV